MSASTVPGSIMASTPAEAPAQKLGSPVSLLLSRPSKDSFSLLTSPCREVRSGLSHAVRASVVSNSSFLPHSKPHQHASKPSGAVVGWLGAACTLAISGAAVSWQGQVQCVNTTFAGLLMHAAALAEQDRISVTSAVNSSSSSFAAISTSSSQALS